VAKDPSKTEKATPRRRQKAREEGQVLKSQDIPIAVSLLLTAVTFFFYLPYLFYKLQGLFRYSLSQSYTLNLSSTFLTLIFHFFTLILPIMLVLLLGGIGANVAQFGFLLSFKPLVPKLDNVNPVKGLSRIFSIKTFFESLKSTLKLAVAVVVGYFTVKSILTGFYSYASFGFGKQVELLARSLVLLFFTFALLSVPIALADFLFRRWEYEENLKMSKQEVKEERKQYEGHPLVKSAIRRRQREIAMRRMMAEVPKADVVITNPTHYAVALKYERGKMHAPKVVAKGKDRLALKIKEVAFENNVPIEENPSLARALYESCEVGDFIPEKFYRVVAKILARVYRARSPL
jgi:flagellar biosynthetic protein FlhB